MSGPSYPPKPRQLSPEEIQEYLMGFGRRAYLIATFPNDRPIWSTRLRLPKLGKSVFVEVTSHLALRIRDRETGEVLAQSVAGDFHTLDVGAKELEDKFEQWIQTRQTLPVLGDDA